MTDQTTVGLDEVRGACALPGGVAVHLKEKGKKKGEKKRGERVRREGKRECAKGEGGSSES